MTTQPGANVGAFLTPSAESVGVRVTAEIARNLLAWAVLSPLWLTAVYACVAVPHLLVSMVIPEPWSEGTLAAAMIGGAGLLTWSWGREVAVTVRGIRGLPDPRPRPRSRPIVGHRVFALVTDATPWAEEPIPVLAGPVSGALWWSSESTATCDVRVARHPDGSRVPSPECTCGIYAVRSTARLPGRPSVHVVARVELEGRVLEGERGYRAERARLVGPYRLVMRCAGGRMVDTFPCDAPPVAVVVREAAFEAFCGRHLPTEIGPCLDPPAFEVVVERWLGARYGIGPDKRGGR